MSLKYNINIGGDGEYFYLKDYFPKNTKTEHTREELKYSELILKYKKGDNGIITFFTRILNNIIFNYFYFYDLILPIPPSSSYLDVYPNGIVCSYLKAFGNIDTLERAIVCRKGHKPGHTQNIELKKSGLLNIAVADKYDFQFKNIIILDDIVTTGTTLAFIKDILLKKGANSVIGLFLGKTYSLRPLKKEGFNLNG